MTNISISLIQELRNRTNISIIECKKALVDSNGNIQLAIDNLRKNGLIKSAQKSGKMTTEGIIIIQIAHNKEYGVILEINCETDFVSKNDKFLEFGYYVATTALHEKITDINTLKNIFEKNRNILISTLDENINIRRIAHINGIKIGSYLHNNKKIGVLISVKNNNNSKEHTIKQIAMHIAANKPEYINIHHIPINIIEHEKKIQMDIALQSGKSYEIAKKITEGRIKQFISEISLMNQTFIMDTTKTIENILNEHNIQIDNFVRFEMGEHIKQPI